MNITQPACPPIPNYIQLLNSGLYYEVNIESLLPQENVILYIHDHPSGPYTSCIHILENPSSPGRIRWRQSNQLDASVESNISYILSEGFRFFKRYDEKHFKQFLEEQDKFHKEHDNKINDDKKNNALRNLAPNIVEFLQIQKPHGGRKYQRSKRTKRTKRTKRRKGSKKTKRTKHKHKNK